MKNEKKEIVISRKDEAAFLELIFDEKAAAQTLRVALAHHHNALTQIGESKRKLWDHCIEVYKLDENKAHKQTYSLKDSRMIIIETDEE